jgi:hypothetical protein
MRDLKIEEIFLPLDKEYDFTYYPRTGLYLVNDTEVVHASRETGDVTYICLKKNLKHLQSDRLDSLEILLVVFVLSLCASVYFAALWS